MGLLKIKRRNESQLDFNGKENGAHNLLDARDFRSKCIACFVSDEERFSTVLNNFEHLGFEVACSSHIGAVFESVAEDCYEWSMIVVCYDENTDQHLLRSFVRLVRMMEIAIPVLVYVSPSVKMETSRKATQLGDCVFREPSSLLELSEHLELVCLSNRNWRRAQDTLQNNANRQFFYR